MSHDNKNNIGAFLAIRQGLAPLANAAGTRNGTGVDRQLQRSVTIVCNTGAATGSPSSGTLDVKLQDSADNSTFADISGAAFSQKTTTTAEIRSINVDLSGAARYVRVVEVTALTGGTSPTLPNSVSLVFGGSQELPNS